MASAKSDAQPGEPRASLIARYPLTFYFIIALGGTDIRLKKDVTSAGFCH
jgi:hypothetical protein